MRITFNENIDTDGENKELTVERISMSIVAVNEHESGGDKIDTVDDHMAEWEDYLIDLYGKNTSIEAVTDDNVILTWEEGDLEKSEFKKIDLEVSYTEGPNENPAVHVTFE